MMAPVLAGHADWLLRVAAVRSHSQSCLPSQVCQPQADLSQNPEPLVPTAFPVSRCKLILQAVPIVMHSAESISDVPHFHKMVLSAVITDVFFFL